MRQESFEFHRQWCKIHYPEKPNGFAVFIIGDQQHFVTEETSYWMQNADRGAMIEELTDKGYLVYYSNLYGNHWGNAESVQLARGLYHLIMKKAILNDRIHILAEGMGALTASKLVPYMRSKLRSVVLLTPCISLAAHLEQEKGQKFFYKKIIREIQRAYNTDSAEIFDVFQENTVNDILCEMDIPLYILEIIDRNRYEKQKPMITSIYNERIINQFPVTYHYILFENRLSLPRKLSAFFNEYEKEL